MLEESVLIHIVVSLFHKLTCFKMMENLYEGHFRPKNIKVVSDLTLVICLVDDSVSSGL